MEVRKEPLTQNRSPLYSHDHALKIELMAQSFLICVAIYCFCCFLPWPLIKFFYFIHTFLQIHVLCWLISWTQRHMWDKPWSWPRWEWCPFWFSYCVKILCYWVYSRIAVQGSDRKPYVETFCWNSRKEVEPVYYQIFLRYLNYY